MLYPSKVSNSTLWRAGVSSRLVSLYRLPCTYYLPIKVFSTQRATQTRYLGQLRPQNNIILGRFVLLLHYVGMLLLRSGSTGEVSLRFLSCFACCYFSFYVIKHQYHRIPIFIRSDPRIESPAHRDTWHQEAPKLAVMRAWQKKKSREDDQSQSPRVASLQINRAVSWSSLGRWWLLTKLFDKPIP